MNKYERRAPGCKNDDTVDWFVLHADHAAFVARVREITQTLRHWDECEAVTKMIHFEDDAKCTCPRGKLLEVCNG